MAKSSKPSRPQTAAQTQKPTFSAVSKAALEWQDRTSRPSTDDESDGLVKKLFWAVMAVGFVALFWASRGVGINADDKFQNDYSKKLVAYYSTFGRDTSAVFVKDGNMHLYGGFFDATTGFANKWAGNSENSAAYHNLRHAFSAILGWIAILFTAFFAQKIAGWRAALIAALLMFLSPRFFGDSLMNPKDIPFAAGCMVALFNMFCTFEKLPEKPRWQNLAGLALGLGLALGTRAGGILIFAYVGLFGGAYFLMKHGFGAVFSQKGWVWVKYLIPTLAAGWILACLFWPFALQSPLRNPFAALAKFAELEVKIRVLFEGQNMMSDKTPWTYAPKWIWMTVPFAALFGVVGAAFSSPFLIKKYAPVGIFMALFAAAFPVFYIIYKDSVIHDGWRHLTFAYPPMVAAAAIFWIFLTEKFAKTAVLKWALPAVLTLILSGDALAFLVKNPSLSYTYFNPIAGGTAGAFGNFETDYWGISTRQGLEWLEKEGIIGDQMTDTIIIATNMYYPARMLTTGRFGGKARVLYQKWDRRCDLDWDYALYPTRFIEGSSLRNAGGPFPPKNCIHIIEAGGAPILAILKNDGSDCFEGTKKLFPKAGEAQDLPGAIEKLKSEVSKVPNNDLAWSNLAQAYLNSGLLEESKAAAETSLKVAPDNSLAVNLLGMYSIQKNDAATAIRHFEAALKREPSNAGGWYYLALAFSQKGDNAAALSNIQKCIDQAPNYKPAYQLAAQIYQSTGQTEKANSILRQIGGQ